jgi:hypothetical protein
MTLCLQPTSNIALETYKYTKQFKNSKSPGSDGIKNIYINHLPRKAVVLFTRIINSCLRIGYFPTKWKQAEVFAIHKPGKPADLPKGQDTLIIYLSDPSHVRFCLKNRNGVGSERGKHWTKNYSLRAMLNLSAYAGFFSLLF